MFLTLIVLILGLIAGCKQYEEYLTGSASALSSQEVLFLAAQKKKLEQIRNDVANMAGKIKKSLNMLSSGLRELVKLKTEKTTLVNQLKALKTQCATLSGKALLACQNKVGRKENIISAKEDKIKAVNRKIDDVLIPQIKILQIKKAEKIVALADFAEEINLLEKKKRMEVAVTAAIDATGKCSCYVRLFGYVLRHEPNLNPTLDYGTFNADATAFLFDSVLTRIGESHSPVPKIGSFKVGTGGALSTGFTCSFPPSEPQIVVVLRSPTCSKIEQCEQACHELDLPLKIARDTLLGECVLDIQKRTKSVKIEVSQQEGLGFGNPNTCIV